MTFPSSSFGTPSPPVFQNDGSNNSGRNWWSFRRCLEFRSSDSSALRYVHSFDIYDVERWNRGCFLRCTRYGDAAIGATCRLCLCQLTPHNLLKLLKWTCSPSHDTWIMVDDVILYHYIGNLRCTEVIFRWRIMSLDSGAIIHCPWINSRQMLSHLNESTFGNYFCLWLAVSCVFQPLNIAEYGLEVFTCASSRSSWWTHWHCWIWFRSFYLCFYQI